MSIETKGFGSSLAPSLAGEPRANLNGSGALLVEPVSFWFVWTKYGRVPRFAHDTPASAAEEAARLAHKHPGRKFIVLHAYTKFSVPVSSSHEARTDDQSAT